MFLRITLNAILVPISAFLSHRKISWGGSFGRAIGARVNVTGGICHQNQRQWPYRAWHRERDFAQLFGIISKFSCGGCNITCYGKAPFFRRVLHLYISALTGKGVENSVIKEMRFFHEILSCNFSVLVFLKKWLLSWFYEE